MFGDAYQWTAPELLEIGRNAVNIGAPTVQSDIFALGMVAVEVTASILSNALVIPKLLHFQVFTGRKPFPRHRTLGVPDIARGKRPLRPSQTSNLGLSGELWAAIESLWAHQAGDRLPLSTFIDLLERAIPDITLLEELMEFDVNSGGHMKKLEYIFNFGDITLLGMREYESLVLVEVFDRVGFTVLSVLALWSDFPPFQLLNSSIDDEKIRTRCLRGLGKASARWGLLPKSYWIAQSSFTQPDEAFSTTGRVFDTCKRSIGGELVAVKTINLGCILDFDIFKKVRLADSSKRLSQI